MRMIRLFLSLLFALMLLVGCGGTPDPAATSAPAEVVSQGGATMKLTSSAFAEGTLIPRKYSCDGDDVSPPLAWSDVPAGARSLALICDDPDAPVGTWVHWVVFNLPPTVMGLSEGVPAQKAAAGGMHGANSWRRLGYGGPCPPSGTHRYFFKLYALDTTLALDNTATAKDVQAALAGHVLAQAQLMGKYQRAR